MSLRYVGKMVYQAAAATSLRSAALQGSKSAKTSSSGLTSSRQTQGQPGSWRFSNRATAGLAASASEKLRLKEEESLRTIMFLSSWGPF